MLTTRAVAIAAPAVWRLPCHGVCIVVYCALFRRDLACQLKLCYAMLLPPTSPHPDAVPTASLKPALKFKLDSRARVEMLWQTGRVSSSEYEALGSLRPSRLKISLFRSLVCGTAVLCT